MKVNCAYKFELILKPEQRAKCAQFVGNCRYVYNKAVEIQLRQLETKQPFVSYKELASQLVGWKKDDSSLFGCLNHRPRLCSRHSRILTAD